VITEQELDKRLMTLKIIWFAMLMSLGIYLFVGIHVGTNARSSINEDMLGILRTVLYAMAVAILIATRYIRKLIMSGKSQVSQPAQALEHLALQKYSAATIVALAMSESIGIYGLILFFLGKNSKDLYLLILISAAAMVMYRPRKDEMLNLVQGGPVDLGAGGGTSPDG
jgi:F0F1-type ATP synthase membrane subunit c/vacuolar-type H+-ATPase subunit K